MTHIHLNMMAEVTKVLHIGLKFKCFKSLCLVLLWFYASLASPNGLDLKWLELSTNQQSVEEVIKIPKDKWQPIKAGSTLNQGFSDGDFWLRVSLPAQQRNHLLEISYPLLDEVSVHWEIAGQIIEAHHTGDALPFYSRPISHRNFVFHVPLSDEQLIAWVRVHTSGSVQVPISITPTAQFLANEQVSFGWQAMFFGIVASLALYNLILFGMVRHTTYLLYVLVVVSTASVQLNFNGLLFQWLWPNSPSINQYFTVPAVASAMFFALMFIKKFLLLQQFSLRINHLFSLLQVAALMLFIYGFFGSYQHGIVMISVLAAFITPIAWVTGLLVWRKGQVLAKFYVLAWTPLLVGHMVLAVSKLGLLPRSTFTELAPQVGVALEAILLSFALAYRINIERRKRLLIEREATLTLEARVQERTLELQKANDKLKAVSLTDGLTGVANRRRFNEKLNEEWRSAIRHKDVLSLVLVDIDHFKSVNDTYGHLAGDDCLVAVATVMRAEIERSDDLLARYGGEEFAILLPGTHAKGAFMIAERIRAAIERAQVEIGDDKAPLNLTVSLGVVTLMPSLKTSEQDLIRFADTALYKAKDTGRNRVIAWCAEDTF